MNFSCLFKIFIFIACFFCMKPSLAEQTKELSSILNTISTYKASFVQEVFTSKHEKSQKSSGKIFVKKPNLFRWEVIKPGQSIIVINKNKVWNYDKDLEQVTIQDIQQESMTNSAFFLSEDTKTLEKNYNIYMHLCKKENLFKSKKCFKLVPKNENTPFQHLLIGFNDKILKELVLYDQLGQITKIYFSKYVVNKQINNKLFTLKIPKNVDVVNNGS